MNTLPIVKMTLYKHGVGFYQRRGTVDTDTSSTASTASTASMASLQFRRDEMNDILKSLTAFTVGGGQVLGMDYATPEDKAALLARSSIQLSDGASLRDLLRDVRGRAVEVITAGETLAGIAVGVDLPGEREPLTATLLSIFVPGQAAVRTLPVSDIRQLNLVDARAAGDLAYFLDTSLMEDEKRSVTVRLAPGPSDLVVSYIAPSPIWRVSYRLVADEQDGKPLSVLQGWGLFDNTFDEDLENVHLTFVAGMPVSFIYDLYTPFTPERPVVREEARAVARPVEFAEALSSPPPAMRGVRALGRTMMADERQAPAPAAKMSAADLSQSTVVAATGQAQGEFFSYVVANPVTVKRGRSAMVPILQAQPALRKERIYNGRKHPLNPVITARFKNETGLTLERGPLTVVEAGEYAGEAMLPFTAPGGEIFLAYAVDLGVKVTEETTNEQLLVSVNIANGLLSLQEYQIQRVTYRVENRNDQAVNVTLEHPRLANYTPFDTPDPVETTADAYRYLVQVKAHSVAVFTAAQRRLVARREEVRNQRFDTLQRWLRDHLLDQAAFDRIKAILALYDRLAEHETSVRKNETNRQAIFNQQKVVQGNLGALKEQGEEGQLRGRYVRTLNQLEDQLAQLKTSDDELAAAIARTKAEIDKALAG